MATGKRPVNDTVRPARFRVEGRIQREQADCQPGAMELTVCVYDRAGALLGRAVPDGKGNYGIDLRLSRPVDVTLMVGPAGSAGAMRQSDAYRKDFQAREWQQEGTQSRLKFDALLPLEIWRPWWPRRVCVSGHVRKVNPVDGIPGDCPVPYAKVEIFDVDREACLWPPLRNWWEELLDRPVIRLPDLLREPPFPPPPLPGPDPLPDLNPAGPGLAQRGLGRRLAEVAINPQPEPPGVMRASTGRVGEAGQLDGRLAARLDRLTVTSRFPPWRVFPHCFYSKAEVAEATTDCSGYFSVCFDWWPLHFRRGRLRFDARPDLIVKVTQVIDGVATVIYLDPYTSTRWNVDTAHIDLYLDDEEVRCGAGCLATPAGTEAFFTLVGNDEVYRIDQVNGKYGDGILANWAYGGSLLLCALFGDALSAGAKRYYRLSCKKGVANPDPDDNSGFVPITQPLYDTRVDKATWAAESVLLGPQPVNDAAGLYEIRNRGDYYWYNPDKIGWWLTEAVEPDAGLYTLRLEVFNELGVKLDSSEVSYLDGTDAPPGPLPVMGNRCDLVVLVDNQAPDLALDVPGASGECGVVPFSAVPGLTAAIQVNQAHGRLYQWGLGWVKGITGGGGTLDGDSNASGIAPVPVVKNVATAPMTAGLTGTCAFSLTLSAWPLVRNGYGAIHQRSRTIAIAVEKCPACPPCDLDQVA